MEVAVDYASGTLERRNVRDLIVWMQDHGTPITVKQAAAFLSAVGYDDVTDAQRKRAQRRLDLLVSQGRAAKDDTGVTHTYVWTREPTLVIEPQEEKPTPW
jgi:hypothetical protein